jgi:hypothetical protein
MTREERLFLGSFRLKGFSKLSEKWIRLLQNITGE